MKDERCFGVGMDALVNKCSAEKRYSDLDMEVLILVLTGT